MKDSLLTTKSAVLNRINDYEEGKIADKNAEDCYASQISRDLEKTNSHTQKILKDLEEQDLIEFRNDPHNDRKKLLGLTEHGKAIAQNLAEIVDYGKENDIRVY